MDLVPRHQQIVARILGEQHSASFTRLIGLAEILMVVWILSGYRRKVNVAVQITVVTTMNVIEFFLAPDLLLFGKLNSVMALLFVVLVYCNEILWYDKITSTQLNDSWN